MKVRIINCSDKTFWYNHFIGRIFKVIDCDKNRYYTITKKMKIKIPILKIDCEVAEK